MRLRSLTLAAAAATHLALPALPAPVRAKPARPPARRSVSPSWKRPRPATARTPHTLADVAVAAARAQLGKPYRWSGAGPEAFDCSGLTMFSWRKAGVSLPHSSAAQYAALPTVPLAGLRPGDLVYSRGHIGMYVGDGKMIHAPETGRRVEVAPLRPNTIGAVRPA